MAAYLDCAAHSPIDPAVAKFMAEHHGAWGNPHNLSHFYGREAARAVDLAREQVAQLFGAPADEVTFTSGATEANNMAVFGAAAGREHDFSAATTSAEHVSVLSPFQQVQRTAQVEYLPVDSQGNLLNEDLHGLPSGIDFMSILWVNNETGAIQPLTDVADASFARGAVLHVDATQAVGRIETGSLWQFADLISLSGHKIGGPSGIGALIGGKEHLAPLFFGGNQQGGLRPGTVPTMLVSAFGHACEIRQKNSEKEREYLEQQTTRIRSRLGEYSHILSPENAAPGILTLAFEGIESESLVALLDDVAVSRGSACSDQQISTSHVLAAMGVSKSEANCAIRISLGAQTTIEEIDYGLARILDAVSTLQTYSGSVSLAPLHERCHYAHG